MEQNNQNAPASQMSPADTKKLIAVASYFLFFIPFFTEHKEDPTIKFHTKQSLALLIVAVFLNIVSSIVFALIFGIAFFLFPVLVFARSVVFTAWFVAWLYGIYGAATGKNLKIPFVYPLAERYLKF